MALSKEYILDASDEHIATVVPVETVNEQRIVTGLIVNTKFCELLFPRVDAYLFDVDYFKILFIWIRDYFEEFLEAPKHHIQDIFKMKSKSMDAVKAEILSNLLTNLSNKYLETENEELEKEDNPNFLWINVAVPYFRGQLERQRFYAVSDLREKGKHDDADELDSEYEMKIKKLLAPTEEKTDFKPISLKELLEKEREERMFLLDEILPCDGLAIVGAKPKVGKTTFALNAGLSIARGKPFLGLKTIKVPVVYLALEESESQVRTNLIEMGVDKNEENFYLWFGMAPQTKELTEKIEKMIVKYHAGLVIIDPLQKLLRVKDGNSYAEVTNSLEPYNEIARKRNCCILFTHHSGKIVREGGDDLLGSIAHSGGVDTIFNLRKKQRGRGSVRVITTVQRYGNPIEEETVVSLNEHRCIYKEGTLSEITRHEILDIIEGLLIDGSSITQQMIMEETKLKPNNIVDCLKWAVETGVLNRNGSGSKGSPFKYTKSGPVHKGTLQGPPLKCS